KKTARTHIEKIYQKPDIHKPQDLNDFVESWEENCRVPDVCEPLYRSHTSGTRRMRVPGRLGYTTALRSSRCASACMAW
ncbi:MAG: hypothetical protein ACLU6D_11255, partial [Gordonibacter urolithinfaciens]